MFVLRRLAIIAASALAAQACASNALQIDTAGEVVKASSAAVTAAKASVAATREKRRLAVATLIASDRSCSVLGALSINAPTSAGAAPAPLCARTLTAPPGYAITKLGVQYISDESLVPTIAMIGALVDYSAVLQKIVDRPTTDVSAELTAAVEKATSAAELAANVIDPAIGEAVASAANAIASEQGKTAVAILQFVVDLSQEESRAKGVRSHVAEHGDALKKALADLGHQLGLWLAVHDQGDAIIIRNALAIAYDNERGQLDFSRRLELARRYVDATADVDSAAARRGALQKALAEVAAVHADLERQIAGGLNDEERRKVAKLNRERLFKAVGLLAAAAAKFGGV